MASLLPTLFASPGFLQRRRPPRSPTLISSSTLPRYLDVAVDRHNATPANKQQQQQQRLPKQDTHRHHHSGSSSSRSSSGGRSNSERDEFYLNLGTAVRTLRDDLPALFSRDLNYGIYREDITFADPLNTFHGIDNYRRIFWALRFHGRVLFREIALDVLRIWQLSDDVILVRWSLSGVPRVPWEAKGHFQGTSRYKLDGRGKIYEHRVDNLAFNLPKLAPPGSVAVQDLVAASACAPVFTAGPSPGFSLPQWGLGGGAAAYECPWVEFYRAVKETVDRSEQFHFVAGVQSGLVVTCS